MVESDEGLFRVTVLLLLKLISILGGDCRMPGTIHPSPVVPSLPDEANKPESHADDPYDKQDSSQCQCLNYGVHCYPLVSRQAAAEPAYRRPILAAPPFARETTSFHARKHYDFRARFKVHVWAALTGGA